MSHDLGLAQSYAFQLSRDLVVPVTAFEVDGEYSFRLMTSTQAMTSRSFTNTSHGDYAHLPISRPQTGRFADSQRSWERHNSVWRSIPCVRKSRLAASLTGRLHLVRPAPHRIAEPRNTKAPRRELSVHSFL
jgi:hypothetical protein